VTSVLVLAACSSNIVLRRRPEFDTGPLGPFARCAVDERACQDDPTYDGARLSPSNTTYFSLPNCAYGIQAILIQDVGSSDSIAIVRCAAPPATPLATTGSGLRELPTTTLDGGGGTTQPR
jgi:hypothetical protein